MQAEQREKHDPRLHELAFEAWLKAKAMITPSALEEARATGQPLEEALVLQGRVDFVEVMELTNPRVALRCESCGVVHYVGTGLRDSAIGLPCPECEAEIGGPSPLVPDAAESSAQLSEQAFRAWVLAQEKVDTATLEAMEAQPGSLLEGLIQAGHLSLEEAMGPVERTVEVRCESCPGEFHLGEGYSSLLDQLVCPMCQHSLSQKESTQPVTADVAEDGTLVKARKFGGCVLERLIGRGGMGEVYLGHNAAGEKVAVKTLLRQLIGVEEVQRRFEREARALQRVQHENVIRVLGFGLDESTRRPYVVMEYVEGADLQSVLRRRANRRLDVAEVVYVLRECAQGLKAVHAAKVLHRDLKPSNVFLGVDGSIKLMDFGIALEDDASLRLTAAGEVLGTPQYVPPEALTANEWTPAGDVYALGVMAYRLLSGQPPFPGTNLRDVLLRKVAGPPPSLQELNPGLSADLTELVHRLMAEDPLARPSLDGLLEALDEHKLLPLKTEMFALGSEAEDVTMVPGSLRPDQTLQPGQVFQNYRLEGEIGRGGMGIVYRAHHLGLNKPVAIKLLLQGALASDQDRKRFLREAEAVGALEHPGIVKILDAGESNGTYYLTMEFVEGVTLDAWSPERSLEETCQILSRVCDAVHHAHTRGVIHRDLKPDNVLVDTEGQPHVLDFGLAKQVGREREEEADLTTQGDIMGTLRYMPPEQAEGRAHEVDVRSDVYALGSILYHELTGHTPFTGNMHQLLQQIMFDVPRAPSTFKATVPWELDAICLKSLEKDPDRRYQSAVALRQDLQSYLEGKPITARRATAWYRFTKWVRRNKAKAGVAVAAILLVAAIPTAVVLRGRQAEQERLAQALEHTQEGWTRYSEGRFSASSEAFVAAQAQLKDHEQFQLPAAALALIPENELRTEFVSDMVLEAWKLRAEKQVRTEEALQLIAEGRALQAEGKTEEALDKALRAADRIDLPELRELFAGIASDRLPEVERLLARDEALRKERADDEAFRLRRSALGEARQRLREVEQLDKRAGGASADAIAKLRAAVAGAEARVGADQLVRRRVIEARERLLNAMSESGFLAQAAQAPPEEAARLLRQAKRELSVAISLHGELEGVREGLTKVSLAGAELALGREQLELARLELDDARIYGLLTDQVDALAARIAAQNERLADFKRELSRADRFYGEERYAEALASYDLALGHHEDPDARTRRDLTAARLAVAEAERKGDRHAQREALLELIALHPDPKRWRTTLVALDRVLYQDALAEADREFAEAVRRDAGWQEAAEAYGRALRYDPQGPRAQRLRADAYAQRDRPDGMILVSIPLRLLASGAGAAQISDREARRFYLQRTEVTNARYAEFVAAGGYVKPEYWKKPGWAQRARFVDATGEPGPATWSQGKPLPGSEDFPVNGISYHEARAYAAFRGLRLPTAREWRLAACFNPQTKRWQRFPTGDALLTDPTRKTLRAAGRNQLDVSPWGARDMGFNVTEWVRQATDDPRATALGLSAFYLEPDVELGVLDWRKQPDPSYRNEALGFRCAADVPPPPPFAEEEGQ